MKLYVCWGTFSSPRPGGHPCKNAADALKVLRVKAGLPVSQSEPCADVGTRIADGHVEGDVNCNSSVNSVDALLILRYAARLPVTIPPECPALGPP